MNDFIPEALTLGASFAINHSFGFLLALLIVLQNLPKRFNSYIELRKNPNKIKTISGILLCASGGILYVTFQNITPLSRHQKDWIPATCTSFVFLLDM